MALKSLGVHVAEVTLGTLVVGAVVAGAVNAGEVTVVGAIREEDVDVSGVDVIPVVDGRLGLFLADG
ncbi:MAG: hypothetical protein ACRDZ8_04020 [Acidimicrobiales bacterium]